MVRIGMILLEMQLCGRKRLQRTMTFGIPAIGEDKNCIAGNYTEQVGRLLYNCDQRGQGKDSTKKLQRIARFDSTYNMAITCLKKK